MSYKANYTAKARKDLKNLPPDVAQRIILSINGYQGGPLRSCHEDQKDKTSSTLHLQRLRIPGDHGHNRGSPADHGDGNRAQKQDISQILIWCDKPRDDFPMVD